jgi:hypothetical protein
MTRSITILAVLLALAGCASEEPSSGPAGAPATADPQALAPDPLPGPATTPSAPPDPLFNAATPDGAPRVTVAEILPSVGRNEVVLLDVRSAAGWAVEHAEGAVHIPLEDLGMRAGELPRGRPIVAYCT